MTVLDSYSVYLIYGAIYSFLVYLTFIISICNIFF